MDAADVSGDDETAAGSGGADSGTADASVSDGVEATGSGCSARAAAPHRLRQPSTSSRTSQPARDVRRLSGAAEEFEKIVAIDIEVFFGE